MVTNDAIQLTDVVHQTFFEIDENGLEAAAATAVQGSPSSMLPEPIVVTIDRPFQLVLRDVNRPGILGGSQS